jgi:hypothetical protein
MRSMSSMMEASFALHRGGSGSASRGHRLAGHLRGLCHGLALVAGVHRIAVQIPLEVALDAVRIGKQARGRKPAGGLLDGFLQSILIAGELLQHHQAGVDDHHRVEDIGALLPVDQIERGAAGAFALVRFVHGFECQCDQTQLAQGVEFGYAAAFSNRLGTLHQAEAGYLLLGAVVNHRQIRGLEVRDRFAFLVAGDKIQDDFVDCGFENGSLGAGGGSGGLLAQYGPSGNQCGEKAGVSLHWQYREYRLLNYSRRRERLR